MTTKLKVRAYTVLGGLWPYLKSYKGTLTLLIICLMAEVAFSVLIPLVYRYVLDVVIYNTDLRLLGLISFGFISGFILFRLIPEYALIRIGTYISSGITAAIRIDLFRHLETLPLDFYRKIGVSEPTSAFSEDIRAIEAVILTASTNAMKYFLTVLLSYLLIFYIYYPIALLILTINLVAFIIPRFFIKKRDLAINQYKQKENALLKTFYEFLSTFVILRLYSLLDHWFKQTSENIKKISELNEAANFYIMIGAKMFYVSFFLCEMTVVIVGAFAVHQNHLTIGSVFSIVILTSFILRGTDWLTHFVPQVIRAALAMKRINSFLAEKPAWKAGAKGLPLPMIESSIEFQNVTFSDENKDEILKNIDLKIEVGKSIAFVGPSGSGKSAILKLMMRLLEPTEGKIVIDDVYDLNEVEENSFRNQFGVVLQESLLFNLTIEENILLGKPGSTKDEMMTASKKANFHEDVLLFPQGYQTKVGELGNFLSGGQKQRLALARALIRNPQFLLLDEVTSSLDALSEAEINENLLECKENTTLVMATHRLQIAAGLDCIYVLDKGKIVEKGSHNDLLKLGGLYSELWQKQNNIQLTSEQQVSHINIGYLKSIPILQSCPEPFLEELSHHFSVESYAAGETLIEEGSYGNNFFLIARGELDVIKKQKLVASLREGDYFGEISLLFNMKRTATIRARTYVVLLQLSRSHFNKLLNALPEVKKEVHHLAEIRMRNMDVD